jgi:hypothetical protein
MIWDAAQGLLEFIAVAIIPFLLGMYAERKRKKA